MSWLADLLKASETREVHQAALRGKRFETCAACGGTGYSEPSYTDEDGYYVRAETCPECRGGGRHEVPCTPKAEAKAIRKEISKLQKRLAGLV